MNSSNLSSSMQSGSYMKTSDGNYVFTHAPVNKETLKGVGVDFLDTQARFFKEVFDRDSKHMRIQDIDGKVLAFSSMQDSEFFRISKFSIEDTVLIAHEIQGELVSLTEWYNSNAVYIKNPNGYLLKTCYPIDVFTLKDVHIYTSLEAAIVELNDGSNNEAITETSFALVSKIDGKVYVSDSGVHSGFVHAEDESFSVEDVIVAYEM